MKGGAPCPPAQVLDWLEQAASALDAAHEAGVVHRDVKPGNLLLDDRGQVHVADFGIASAAGMDSFTKTGTILGTAGYLSPEQARGERAGAASDRYALAIVAWELLTGHRPFEARSATEEAAAHINTPVPSVHAANPSLPQSFDAVFRRALAKDPSRRYPSAAEFVAALRGALHDDAGDTRWFEPAPTAATRVIAPSPARRIWIPLLVLLVLAGGVLAAVLALRGGDKAATAPPQNGRPDDHAARHDGAADRHDLAGHHDLRDDRARAPVERERRGAEQRRLREDGGRATSRARCRCSRPRCRS